MHEIKTIWAEEIPVRSFETDINECWKPASFFQAMQEAATHHASHFGYDYRTMLARKQIWLLSRAKVRFYEFPVLGANVLVRTWPKGIDQKVFFMRDFQFEDLHGKQYAAATTAWLLIDPTARRMLLPSALIGSVPDNNGLSALNETLEKIDLPVNMEDKLNIDAGYSSVVLMGHVNNSRYVEWICDCFPLEFYNFHRIESIQVNYNHEVKPGERLSITAGRRNGEKSQWVLQGMNMTTSGKAFDALLSWGNESSS